VTPTSESHVEELALSWFEELNWSVLHGADIAPEEAALDLFEEMKNVVVVAELAQGRIAPLSGLRSGQPQIAVMGEERVDE